MGEPIGDDVKAALLQELAEGESLKSLCLRKEYPNEKTVFKWLAKDEAFRAAYAGARQLGVEKHANEIIELADEAALSKEAINKARLQIDARKWILSKMVPKKYGDSLALAGDASRPLALTITSEDAGIL